MTNDSRLSPERVSEAKTTESAFRFEEEDLILYHGVPRKLVFFEFHAAFLRPENLLEHGNNFVVSATSLPLA